MRYRDRMGDPMHDTDLAAVQNPATTPARLADIAARRGDLHPLIVVVPGQQGREQAGFSCAAGRGDDI